MKKIAKFILCILTILFTILLSVDITIFTIRKISEKYFSKESITNIINNIDINDLLKQNGEELEQVKVIKEKLREAGIPEELITDFISSEPMKEITVDITNRAVDYVFYGKKIEYQIEEDKIYSFLEDNLPIISKELQEKNIPKSEYLTEENQRKILEKIKEETPVIKQKLDQIIKEIESKLQNNEYQNKLNKILSIIRTLYSNQVTILLISLFITCIVFIVLTRRSVFKSFKWVGYAYLVSSCLLYFVSLMIPILLNNMNETSGLFMNIITPIFDKLVQLLQQYGLYYMITALILIILNIVIYIIKKQKNNKVEQFL